MICTRATYYTDLEMIEHYQKTCDWNSKSTKTKNYVTNYSRYTMLKIFLWLTLGRITVMRISKKKLWSTISILKPWHCRKF